MPFFSPHLRIFTMLKRRRGANSRSPSWVLAFFFVSYKPLYEQCCSFKGCLQPSISIRRMGIAVRLPLLRLPRRSSNLYCLYPHLGRNHRLHQDWLLSSAVRSPSLCCKFWAQYIVSFSLFRTLFDDNFLAVMNIDASLRIAYALTVEVVEGVVALVLAIDGNVFDARCGVVVEVEYHLCAARIV